MDEVEVHIPMKSDLSVSYIKNKYYVYALFKKEDVNPFYIGKGINNRINQHFMDSSLKRETNRKSRTIRKYFRNIRREILCYFDKEDDAFDLEEYLISYYKLVAEGGSLLNVTKTRHEIPETTRKINSEKRSSRKIVYSEEEVLTLYRNYFENRKDLRECVEGTTIPRRYSSAIVRGERFKFLYSKYIRTGLVVNRRKPEDKFLRKDPENQKVSDEKIKEIFSLVCSGNYTLDELSKDYGCSSIWLGKVFLGFSRRYLRLDYELYNSLPKGKHVAMERAYSKFLKYYPGIFTDVELLSKEVGRSTSVIYRFIKRYKKEMETLNGS